MRIKRQPHSGKRIRLWKFTVSYLSLLLVIIILGGCMFAMAVDVVSRQTADANAMMLEQIAVQMESSFNEVNYYVYSISKLDSIRGLMQFSRPLKSDNVIAIRQAMKSLSMFEDYSRLFVGCQIYFRNADFILESGNSCLNIDFLYGKGFSYGDMDVAAWRRRVLQGASGAEFFSADNAMLGGNEKRMLLYTKKLLNRSHQTGRVIFYIDEAALRRLLNPLVELKANCVMLLDSGGTLLASTGALAEGVSAAQIAADARETSAYAAHSGNNRLMVFSRRLSGTGCVLAAITPYSAVIHQASEGLSPMLIVVAVLVLAGIALTIYNLRTNRRPLVKTLEILARSEGKSFDHRGLRQLDQAVHQIVSSQTLLTKRLEEQKTELRSAVVASLESGDTLDDSELDILLGHVGINPEGDLFRGVYLILRNHDTSGDLERDDMRRALVVELLSPFAPHISFLSLKDRYSFILLYAQKNDESVDIQALLNELYYTCRNAGYSDVSFFVGTECTRLCYLPHSLFAARQLMLREDENSFIMIAGRETGPQEAYVYSDQQEKKLISLVYMGREEELTALMNDLYEENQKRSLTRFHRQLLFFRMVGTLSGIVDASEIPQELKFSLHKLDMDKFFEIIGRCYTEVCRNNRRNRTERTEALLSQILTYLDNSCTDSSLSLCSTAMRFGVTEKYLSAFIHTKAGISFSSYVEQLRIGKANELLADASLTIDEIAQRVGYTNVKTFRRAYSRVVGVAPSETRKLAVLEKTAKAD